jgi:hypothetical protein
MKHSFENFVFPTLIRLNTIGVTDYEKTIHLPGTGERVCNGGLPDAGTDGPGPAGNGSSNSIESSAIRHELSKRNRTGAFEQRESA